MSAVRDTAEQRLERILYILPAAHRQGGVSLDELARALGVDPTTVLRDLEEVTAREFYHPAGTVEAFTATIEADRVRVWTTGGFERPVRLNQREALALQLGLRVLAADRSEEDRADLLALAARLERELTVPETPTVHVHRLADQELASPMPLRADVLEIPVEYDREVEQELLVAVGDDMLRGLFAEAIEGHRLCRLLYLKPTSRAPEARHVAPLYLVHQDGLWYLLAHDLERHGTRLFRIDRILDAAIEEGAAPPLTADAELAHIREHAAAYIADGDMAVTVRYGPAIAPWIAERAGVEPESDGSVAVQHRVADPHWLVQHVLQYGGEAWIDEPADLREMVADAAAALTA